MLFYHSDPTMADRQNLNCRRCGKCFELTVDLNVHLREEHGIYRGHIFKCREGDCEYTTHRSFNLRRHLELKHARGGKRTVRHREGGLSPDHDRAPPLKLQALNIPTCSSRIQPKHAPTQHNAPAVESVRLKIPSAQGRPPSSPVISLSPSPNPDFRMTPPSRPSGKPLALLRQNLADQSNTSSESEDEPTTAPQPRLDNAPRTSATEPAQPAPQQDLNNTPQQLPQQPYQIPPDKILASAVEKKTTRYFFNGHVIRQFDTSITYSALVPKDWNNNVDCNYAVPPN